MTAEQIDLGWAVIKSSAVVPAICSVGYAVYTVVGGDPSLVAILFATAVFYVIGWPIAIALGGILAFAYGKRLQERQRDARYFTMCWAIAFGAVGVPFVWTTINGREGLYEMIGAGIVAGIVAGAWFCEMVVTFTGTPRRID